MYNKKYYVPKKKKNRTYFLTKIKSFITDIHCIRKTAAGLISTTLDPDQFRHGAASVRSFQPRTCCCKKEEQWTPSQVPFSSHIRTCSTSNSFVSAA